MELEEMLERLQQFAERKRLSLLGFAEPRPALELKRRGFVVLANLHEEPRELSEEEIEFMIARRGGHVQ